MGNLTNSGNLIDTINSKQGLIIQSANQPTNPNTGDYWYDTTNKLLKYYNGSSRDPVGANVRVLTQSEYDALTPAEKSNGTLYLITGDSEELTIKWANITDKPNFATVATSGSYNDLSNKPTIPSALGDLTGNSDNITEGTTNKFVTSAEKSKISTAVQPGDLAAVATSGSYNDLSDKPTIPSSLGDLSGTSDNITEGSTNKFVTTTEKSKISTAVQPGDLATVATSGDYNDLINLPSIPVDADDVNALPDTTKYGASLSMTMNTSTYVVTAQLKDQDGNNLGTAQTIDLPLESVVVSGSYDSATKKVILKLKDGSTVDFSVADLISGLQSEITSTNKLDADLVDDTNSAHKFVSATEKSTWNGKQAALTTAQLNAVNSGITSAKVSTYDGYATTIAGKQAALNSDQLAAANSGITSAKVSTYDGYATSKQDKLTTQTAYSQKGSATKVPQITTNTLGQVTGITEVDIDAGETYNAGEGISIGDISINGRKGPAPSGFHVPAITEWEGVEIILISLSLVTGDSWRINLHMPFAGYRNSSASIAYQDSGLYWSSSPYGNKASYLYLYSSAVYTEASNVRARGCLVRCFKDSYVAPTSSWTVIQGTLGSAGIFRNQSEGLISITNGTTGYTIMDKNLGATTVYNNGDTLTQDNMGNMYQWGNNYGFPSTGTISKTSSTQVDASTYGPTNPYSNDTFITGNDDWSSVQNDDLRGDTTGTETAKNAITNTGVLSVNGQAGNVTVASPDMSNYLAKDNTTAFTPTGDYQPATKKYVDDNAGTGAEYNAGEGISIGEQQVNARKGPSPEGFHIPATTEWQGLKTIMDGLSLTTGDSWRINLHIPFAGFRTGSSASMYNKGEAGRYWSSSIYRADQTDNATHFFLDSSRVANSSEYRAYGLSVRCFKDSYVTPDSSWTVVKGTLGNAGIFWNQAQGLISITNGTTGYTIMDKNLGATTVYNNGDSLSESNCGKYYQWGNNYGFSFTGNITTSSNKVNTSAYGPTNPYSSDTFITADEDENGDWSAVRNDDLWGDVTGTVSQDNVITNTGVLSVNGQTGNVTIQTGSEQNLFIITEDMVTVSTDATKGVAPYNTSYGYTNIDINANAGIEWKEGAIYTFVVNTKMVVASAYRNVRVRIGSGAYIPVMGTTAAAAGHSYFAKTAIRQFQYTTKYESGGGLHVFTDTNTTYKAMTAAEATAGTATTALTISPSVLKGAITTHAPVKSVNGSTGAVTVQPTISDLSTIRTNATNGATVVSGDSGQNYVIKVSTTAPASGTAGNIITIVTD